MRPIFTIFALIFTLTLYSCGETIVDYNEDKEHIEERSDVVYYKQTPFSGTLKNHYENGQLERKETFKDGKRYGTHEWYYENGQLKEKETYKDGKANGPHISYHENGQLYIKGTYKDDKGVGTLEMYDEDGTVLTKGTWGDGRETPKWTPMVK